RNNTIPDTASANTPLITDNFAVLKGSTVLVPVQSGLTSGSTNTGTMDFVDGRGGSLQRNFTRGPGFGLFGNQKRNRYEINAHMQNISGEHTIKWGFEWNRNKYDISTISSGPAVTYANPLGVTTVNLPQGAVATNGVRITNNWGVCTVRGTIIVCPSATSAARLTGGSTADFPTAGTTVATGRFASIGLTAVQFNSITTAEAFGNPFLVRTSTRVRDFELNANTFTSTEAFYIQDDYKFARDWQFSIGARWDYQQAYNADGTSYVKFNNFWDNLAPRIGLTWDFTGKGKGKLYANYATYIETPIPLDVNVRAAGGSSQTDKNFNVSTLNAPPSATIATGFTPVNLGNSATPIDPGLKPQSIGEYTAGIDYEVHKDIAVGVRGIYRHMRNVVEDGSFDDGNNYFLFNPGRNEPGTTEQLACQGSTDPADPHAPRCFGRAQRFYRAVEFTATKRFTHNYQFIASYVFSSLTGNYEGLFRNDNGQSDPNITSLFDLQSLLDNTYGRLPNDRPHQFKFNGSYQFPFKLMLSGNFYAQSGTPFNQLIPHPVYGNNEGFAVQRGTAVVPTVTASNPGFPNVVQSIGTSRTPTTFNLDLGFYYPIKLGEKRELRFTGDWFNVFNSQRAVTLDQTFSINSGVAGVPAVVNPFWGSALLIQPPSSFRFGAKFTF
ncbi:MAG TPA: TonB-dependent receptor, partial [Pyrinomonadaceae bacterium]|nr:TonB-dependent receptor [Pyrinomonadaceae bacterium]